MASNQIPFPSTPHGSEPVAQHDAVADDHLTIISGGQTGADRAALDFAIRQGIEHGGWCPQGRRAEDGVIDEQYQLKETDSTRYNKRTKCNVRDSDVTILLTISPKLSGGTAMTARYAENIDKPHLHLWRNSDCTMEQAAQRLRNFIVEHKAHRINIAGPRASLEPEVGAFVRDILTAVLIDDENSTSVSTDNENLKNASSD